jgi:hypothetical protein
VVLAVQITPAIVRIVEPPTQETSVADILMGAVGFVGFVLLAALLVGLVAGGVFILIRKLRERLGHEDADAFSASRLTR